MRRGYSLRTETAYVDWVLRFLHFSQPHAAETLGAADIVRYLGYLAVERNVAASTQNQALNALVFLYGEILGVPLDRFANFARAKRSRRLPVVLTRTEVRSLFEVMVGVSALMARLMYGTGMRLLECVRLRASLRMRRASGAGSTCFRARGCPSTRAAMKRAATTSTKTRRRKPSGAAASRRRSRGRCRTTRSGTRSLRT